MVEAQKFVVPARWYLEDHERPWTMNKERTWHWSKRAKVTKETRERFFWLAKEEGIPKLIKAQIDVVPLTKNSGGPTADVGACYPAAKAAIDGLVDAGVIEDDNDRYITKICFYAAVNSKHNGLRIVITDRG
jgi:crossover junction endodeoxyribonuclease RusA